MSPEQREARELLARVRAREHAKARLDAENAVDLARYSVLCAPDPAWTPPGRGSVDAGEEDLAATLMWTTRHASWCMSTAVTMSTLAPLTLAALASGAGDWARVEVIARGVELLEPHQAAAVDAAVSPLMSTTTLPQLRRSVRRAVTAVAPLAARSRHERGVRRRGVSVRPLDDGLAELVACGPATDVLAAREAVHRRACRLQGRPGEQRSRAAIEFDLLVSSVVADEAARAGAAGADSALVHVTVALPTALGLDEQPGELSGYGAIPADVPRALMTRAGSRLRRLVTDPVTGVLLAVDGHTHGHLTTGDRGTADQVPAVPRPRRSGTSRPTGHRATSDRYRPATESLRFVRLRDGECSVPWCCHPAARCDVDHVTAHPAGPTCECNLQALCRRHHRMKQQRGWGVVRGRDGTTTWTTPTGRVVARAQAPVLAGSPAPEAVDLVDQPPEFCVRRFEDIERFLPVDVLDPATLTHADLTALLTEPVVPEDPLVRARRSHADPNRLDPDRLDTYRLDTDHQRLRAAVRESQTAPPGQDTAPDPGEPPF